MPAFGQVYTFGFGKHGQVFPFPLPLPLPSFRYTIPAPSFAGSLFARLPHDRLLLLQLGHGTLLQTAEPTLVRALASAQVVQVACAEPRHTPSPHVRTPIHTPPLSPPPPKGIQINRTRRKRTDSTYCDRWLRTGGYAGAEGRVYRVGRRRGESRVALLGEGRLLPRLVKGLAHFADLGCCAGLPSHRCPHPPGYPPPLHATHNTACGHHALMLFYF